MVSASTRRLPSTTIAPEDCAEAWLAVATAPTALHKANPARTMPTRQSPLSCRTHNFIRNAPFPTLSTNRLAILRTLPSTMFLQGFSDSATQANVTFSASPAANVPPTPLKTPKAETTKSLCHSKV